MNRKIMILMVAVVATVLPAVAVADVMMNGSVQGLGNQVPDQFFVTTGANYTQANQTYGLGWVAGNDGTGVLSVGYMPGEAIYEANVLNVGFTSTTPGTFYVNITSNASFPAGSYMYLSTSPFVQASNGTLMSSDGASIQTVSLTSISPSTASFSGVDSSTTIYVSVSMGPGPASSVGAFNMEMTFVS
ncbi:MAG: hypothetical protein ACYCSA_04160 [Thermoplasmataceae archaeon]|jgi:hypothetical protein